MRSFRVQRGVVAFGAASASTVVSLPVPVDTARAFPRLTNVQHTDSGRDVTGLAVQRNDDFGATVGGWNSSSFSLTRTSTGESVDHRYYWEVWEDQTPRQAEDGWHVRGVLTTTIGAGLSEMTSGVFPGVENYTRCVPFICGLESERTTRAWGDACITVDVDVGGTVTAKRDPSGPLSRMSFTVALVEFGSKWTVANNLEQAITGIGGGIFSLAGAGSLPWANKFFMPTHRASDSLDTIPAISLLMSPLSGDADTIRITSDVSLPLLAAPAAVVCHVAGHPRLRVEHRDSDQDGLAELTGDEVDVSLEESFDLADTGTVGTTAGSGGLLYPAAHFSYTMLDKDTIRFRRARVEPNTVAFSYQAIQLPRIPQPGGGGMVRGNAVTATAIGDGVTATAHSGG